MSKERVFDKHCREIVKTGSTDNKGYYFIKNIHSHTSQMSLSRQSFPINISGFPGDLWVQGPLCSQLLRQHQMKPKVIKFNI